MCKGSAMEQAGYGRGLAGRRCNFSSTFYLSPVSKTPGASHPHKLNHHKCVFTYPLRVCAQLAIYRGIRSKLRVYALFDYYIHRSIR